MSKVGALLLLLVTFAFAIVLVQGISGFVPWEYRQWLGYAAAVAGIFWIMRSWLRWRTKEIGDRNEIAWLYEVVDEQKRGIHDNRNLIHKALPSIESEHNPTPELEALVQRARRAIGQ